VSYTSLLADERKRSEPKEAYAGCGAAKKHGIPRKRVARAYKMQLCWYFPIPHFISMRLSWIHRVHRPVLDLGV